MLSKPEAGWTTVTLPGLSDHAGYSSDVPTECLDAARLYLKGKRDTIFIQFDAESYGYWAIQADDNKTIVDYIEYPEEKKIINIEALEIAKQIAVDIRKYFDLWVDKWGCQYCSNGRRQIMMDKLISLERLIKEQEENLCVRKDFL